MLTLGMTKTLWVGSSGPLFVSFWLPATSEVDYDVVETLAKSYLARHETFYALNIISEVDKRRDLAKRRGMELMQAYGNKLRGCATVIASKGLSASIARSFVTAFGLMTASIAPMRAFSSPSDAVTWLNKLKPTPQFGPTLGHEIDTAWNAFLPMPLRQAS